MHHSRSVLRSADLAVADAVAQLVVLVVEAVGEETQALQRKTETQCQEHRQNTSVLFVRQTTSPPVSQFRPERGNRRRGSLCQQHKGILVCQHGDRQVWSEEEEEEEVSTGGTESGNVRAAQNVTVELSFLSVQSKELDFFTVMRSK